MVQTNVTTKLLSVGLRIEQGSISVTVFDVLR